MLKIRLTRKGKKNNAFFRLVVAEHTSPIKGKFVEVLGFLNPHTKEKSFKDDRIKYWLSKGAQCSDSVHNLLVTNEIVKGPKRAVKIKKKPVEEKTEVGEKKPEEKLEEAKTEKNMTEKPAEDKEDKIENKKGSEQSQEPKKEAEKVESEEAKK